MLESVLEGVLEGARRVVCIGGCVRRSSVTGYKSVLTHLVSNISLQTVALIL